jgi:hypothetical protein
MRVSAKQDSEFQGKKQVAGSDVGAIFSIRDLEPQRTESCIATDQSGSVALILM